VLHLQRVAVHIFKPMRHRNMAELHDFKSCSYIIDREDGNLRRLKWRLDLVYQYKLYFDRVAEFSREQFDFINYRLNPEKMRLLACRYRLAITDAVKLIESRERCLRSTHLTAELTSRVRMTGNKLGAGDRRQRHRRENEMSAVVRRILKLRRSVGCSTTKSFLLRQSYSMALVDAILALPAERRVQCRRQNR
jgi:hypothetical protein